MHKNIALVIEQLIKTSPYYDGIFTCKVHPQKTNGFWSMDIKFTNFNNAHSKALTEYLHNIGMVHGESLIITQNGKTLEVS